MCYNQSRYFIICDEVESSRAHPYHREPLVLEGGIYVFCEVHYGATTGHSDIDDRVGYILCSNLGGNAEINSSLMIFHRGFFLLKGGS